MPQAIISVSMAHMLFIISMDVPSAGIIVHFMPLSVMAQVISHIMGIIDAMGALPIMGMFMVIGMGVCMAAFMFIPALRTDGDETIATSSNKAMEKRGSFQTRMIGRGVLTRGNERRPMPVRD